MKNSESQGVPRIFRWRAAVLAMLLGLHGLWGSAAFASALASERWAVIADTIFQHITAENGLPHPATTAVIEDGDGFLWIGTENGLVRWDGYRVRVYRPERGKSDALPDNYVQSLHVDGKGRLWVGTSGGGLARYERDSDGFSLYPAGGAKGLSHVNVAAICSDGGKGLWIGTGGGLDHLDPDSGAVRQLRQEELPAGAPAARAIHALLRDHAGTLWVGARTGLFRLEQDGTKLIAMSLPAAADGAISVESLFEDSAGRVWIGTRAHGVFYVAAENGQIHPVHDRAGSQPRWILSIVEAGPNEIWLGTSGQGILVLDSQTLQSRSIRHDPSVRASLAHDVVRWLYRDPAGLVWAATGNGLSRYDPGQGGILTLFGGLNRANGIADADIHSVMAAKDGRVWLGLRNSGIDIFDPSRGRVGSLRSEPTLPESALPVSQVAAMTSLPSGDVLIGTQDGLYRAEPNGTGLRRLPAKAGSTEALLAGKGMLWIGSLTDGLWSAKLDSKAELAAQRDETGLLTDGRVRALAMAPDGALWVGSRAGLNRLEAGSGKVEKIPAAPDDPQGLSSGVISSLTLDRKGRLWIGTLGGGADLLEGRDEDGRPRFRRFDQRQGMPSANVTMLLTAPDGAIWASTARGLARIDPDRLTVRPFRQAEGDAIPLHSIGAGAVTAEGELLFGGHGGLTVVRPDRLGRSWSFRPPVVITDLWLGGAALPPGRFLPNGAGAAAPLLVQPGAGSLTVEFSALDFSAPERNLYAYKLEGFDRKWTETDATRRIATYNSLPPGNYVLKIRGSNRDGLWSEAALALPITVQPAWYQAFWFRALAALAGLGLIAAVIQGRTALLRHRQRELDALVTRRTEELRLRTAELEERKAQLEKLALFDSLTELANRYMFQKDFQHMLSLAKRQNRNFSLLLLDLDNFKTINDTHGHDAGDAVLAATAGRLKLAVRESDLVGRLGGDEFAILLAEGHDQPGIDGLCQRIVDSFKPPVTHRGQSLQVAISIGVAFYPEHGATPDELFKAADLALYRAKRGGGGKWCWHRP